MEELWTPWRMRYIVSDKAAEGCIFCNLPNQTDHHHYILHRGETCFVIMNLYPYTVGHLMVIPYRHVRRMNELSAAETVELGALLQRSEGILRETLDVGQIHVGINLERAAGAGVEGHLHAHLVPRHPRDRDPSESTASPDPQIDIDSTYSELRVHFA